MIPLPFSVKIEPGPGGLDRIVVTTSTATAHIYLHGAHVTHYQRTNEAPMLFMSAASTFADNKPIRGGVPICFPWFGPRANHPEAPGHGFARLLKWNLVNADERANGEVVIELSLKDSALTHPHWAHAFEMVYVVTIGRSLNMALAIKNTGAQPFTFEEALHTYFSVAEVRGISVTGLENTPYFSKVNNEGSVVGSPEVIRFVSETDRVYRPTTSTCIIDDPGHGRRIKVAKHGSDATVVWNPWTAKAKAMADFGDDEWPSMVCIETANAMESAITLAPGTSHTMSQNVE